MDHSPTLRRVTTTDGVSIAVHRLGDATAPPVILAPGTFSNSSFWFGTRGTGFARHLAECGFEAWVIDFRGHGRSQRPGPADDWNFDDWGRLDITAVIDAVHDEGRTPLLVGHSAGGASILAALAGTPALQDGVAGAIIVATPLPWLQRWRRAAAWSIRLAARHVSAFPARFLRLGPDDELPGVMEQWMDWNLAGHWIGRDGTDYGSALADLHIPVLFLAGSGDHRFAPADACRGLHDRVGSADRLFIEAGRDTGFAEDYGHAGIVVSRSARREVWPLLTDWLRARAIPQTRPAEPTRAPDTAAP